MKEPTQKHLETFGQADREVAPGAQAATPPAPAGAPHPGSGDGQAGAPAKKIQRRAKKANIETELFRAIVNLDFARDRLESAKQLNPPFNDPPTAEDAELLRLRRADHNKAWRRVNAAARRAIAAIPEDDQ